MDGARFLVLVSYKKKKEKKKEKGNSISIIVGFNGSCLPIILFGIAVQTIKIKLLLLN